MRNLLPKYWIYFRELRPDGKWYFNGVKFEELIREILSQQFNGNWEPTPITWDGGKDFVDRSILGEEAWAECKMYDKSLSINKISNSLVLAINKQNVNQILFFSYSSLNKNALFHLAAFSASTKIKVQVFDDERLEHLIINDSFLMRKYFQGFTQKNIFPLNEDLEIKSYFTTDTHVEYSQIKDIQGESKERYPHIPINTVCLYEIFLKSNFITDLFPCVVNLSKLRRDKSLIILNWDKLNVDKKENIEIKLLPGQLISIKLYIAPIKTGLVELSSVKISFNDKIEELKAIKIEVSRLNRPPLIGGNVLQYLHKFEQTISTNSTLCTTIISGKTGVGKSRFLEESKLKLFSQNYTVLTFDGHSDLNNHFSSFSTNLLSQIWRLPNVSILRQPDYIDLPNLSNQNTVFDRVCRLLFYLPAYALDEQEYIDELYALLEYGLFNQRMAIVIDNIQEMDSDSIKIIQKLCFESIEKVGQNILVLAFNTDELIYSQEASIFHEELKKQASLLNSNSLQFVLLEEFSRNQTDMFLNTICGFLSGRETFTEHYPVLTELIHENVLPRPLDLYQLFLAAQDGDEPIAYIIDGLFYINKIEGFHQLIRNVQGKTERIFRYRLNHLKKNKDCLKFLLVLSLTGEHYSSVLKSISKASNYIVELLIQGGWIKYLDGDRISFAHPAIERFFINIIELNDFYSPELKSSIYSGMIKNNFRKEFKLVIFYLSLKKTKNIFLNALEEIEKYNHTVVQPRISFHAKNIFNFIHNSQIEPENYLKHIELICRLSANGNLHDFSEKLLVCRNKLYKYIPVSDAEVVKLFKISRQYASFISRLGQPDKGNKVLQEDLLRVKLLPTTVSEEVKLRTEVNLINRSCVCLKDSGYLSEAFNVGLAALKISQDNNFRDFICLSLIDISAIYKNKKSDSDLYLSYIKKALSYFALYSKEIADFSIELACMENRCRMLSIQGNFENAIKITDELLHIVRFRGENSYLLKGISLKSVFMIQQIVTNKKNTQEFSYILLKGLINELEDLAFITKSESYYLIALHLQAIYNCLTMDTLKAKEIYLVALKRIVESQHLKKISYIPPANIALLYDAVNFWIKNKPVENFPINNAFLIKYGLNNIIEAIKSELPLKPEMLFSIGNYNLPLP